MPIKRIKQIKGVSRSKTIKIQKIYMVLSDRLFIRNSIDSVFHGCSIPGRGCSVLFFKSDSEKSETLAIQNVAEMTLTLNGILVDKWLVHLRLTFLRHSFFNV